MPDYEKMYKTLFNAVTDAIDILQRAQQKTEELYIESEPVIIEVLPSNELTPPAHFPPPQPTLDHGQR